MTNLTKSLFIVSSAIALVAGFMFAQYSRENTISIQPERIQGAIYPEAKELPPFTLVNQLAKPYHKKDLLNHWSLIFVGYTHCPDVCPTTMTVLNQLTEIMLKQKMQPPQVVFLSVDPQRDTPEVLEPYMAYFNKDFIGLTGSLSEVTKLSRGLNSVFRKAPGADGKITENEYLMDHSSALLLINPQGNLQAVLTTPHMPGNIIESILKTQAYYDAINQH